MTEANTPATGPQDYLEVAPTLPTSLSKDWLGRVRGLVSRGWPVWLVASLTLANGLLSMLRVLLDRFPDFPAFFTFLLPWGLHPWNRSLTLVFGFILVYLSLGLFWRKRTAWYFAVPISGLLVLTHIGHGQLWYAATLPAITAVCLLVFRHRFTVRTEFTGLALGISLMVASLALALAYGTIGFWLLDRRDFGIQFNLIDSIIRTVREFTLQGNSDLVPHTRQAHWFLESLNLLGLLAASFAGYNLFRPIAYRLRTLPHEREVLKVILASHGRSSLDFFKLWPDKSYFFSRDHSCCIAYRAAWGVAISLGDPVGPDGELEDTTRAFLRYCSDNGWSVSFHQVHPDLLPMYRRLGFQALKLGEEAVVDLNHFASETSKHKGFRQLRNKFMREGYAVRHYVPPYSPAILEEVEEVSKEWLSIPGRRERGFTLGSFSRNYVNETPLTTVLDGGGRILAFVNEIPSYRQAEATIDMMRHRSNIPNGVMDYLFLGLMLRLGQEGYQRFNLGLAPFSGVGDRPGATLQERAIHQIFEHLNRFFSYKGLRQYKAKFEPIWEERFLVYQGGLPGLVKTGIALVRVTES